jgi:hypothetical protein
VVSRDGAWWAAGVNGKSLAGSEKLAATGAVQENIVLQIPERKGATYHMKITCTGVGATGIAKESYIFAPSTAKLELELNSCKATELDGGNCTLGAETLVSEAIEAKLSTNGVTATADFARHAGEYLFGIPLQGGKCSLAGEGHAIEGSFNMKLPTSGTESVEQQFVGEGEASKGLRMVGFENPEPPVYLTGKFKLKLTSGLAWSFL